MSAVSTYLVSNRLESRVAGVRRRSISLIRGVAERWSVVSAVVVLVNLLLIIRVISLIVVG